MNVKSAIKKHLPRHVLRLYWIVRYPSLPGWKWLQWLRSLRHHLTGPMPMKEFRDYNEYWRMRGELNIVFRRWQIAADLIEDGTSVLDVGCGSGEFLTYLQSRKANAEIAAVDISDIAVQRTREKGFEARVADLRRQPLDKDYDYITCFEVLEHIQDAEVVFSEMIRHVRRRLIVSVPNAGCLRCRSRLAIFGRFPIVAIALHVKEHIRFWTIKDFREWVRALGGEVVGIHGQFGSNYMPWKLLPGLFSWGIVYVVEPRREETKGHSPPPA